MATQPSTQQMINSQASLAPASPYAPLVTATNAPPGVRPLGPPTFSSLQAAINAGRPVSSMGLAPQPPVMAQPPTIAPPGISPVSAPPVAPPAMSAWQQQHSGGFVPYHPATSTLAPPAQFNPAVRVTPGGTLAPPNPLTPPSMTATVDPARGAALPPPAPGAIQQASVGLANPLASGGALPRLGAQTRPLLPMARA